MKKGNVLQFSADGTEFVFLFSNGSESTAFVTKSAGFEAITDLARKGKISVEEFSKMRDEIIGAENLPWEEPEAEMMDLMDLLVGMAMLSFSPSTFLDKMYAPKEPVTIAYYKMCDCGGNHGRIYCKTVYTGRLDYKSQAMLHLEHLKTEKLIDDEEYLKVKSEIEISGLD